MVAIPLGWGKPVVHDPSGLQASTLAQHLPNVPTVPQPFQVLLFLSHSHLVSSHAALLFEREKVVMLLLLSSCSSSTLFFLWLWQSGCPRQGKVPCMIERGAIQLTLTDTLGAGSSGFGLRQVIKLLGILFTVQTDLQEHSQCQALCGGTHELSPQRHLSTALPVTSRFGSWSLQCAGTFPSKKQAAGRGTAAPLTQLTLHPAQDRADVAGAQLGP